MANQQPDIEYTWAVLRYQHDPSSGECLNVGVVLYAGSTGEILLKWDSQAIRLRAVFKDFQLAHHRQVMGAFETAIKRAARAYTGDCIPDVGALVNDVWPDMGLSYSASAALNGAGTDLKDEIEDLFDRFLSNYQPSTRPGPRNV